MPGGRGKHTQSEQFPSSQLQDIPSTIMQLVQQKYTYNNEVWRFWIVNANYYVIEELDKKTLWLHCYNKDGMLMDIWDDFNDYNMIQYSSVDKNSVQTEDFINYSFTLLITWYNAIYKGKGVEINVRPPLRMNGASKASEDGTNRVEV